MAQQLPQYEILRRQMLAQDPELLRLQQQQAQTRGQLYSAPFQAREQYQNIFDPNTREKLISQAVGNILGQLTGYNDLVSQRQGRVDQLVKLSTDYQAEQNAAAKAKADAAQRQFENQIALQKLAIQRAGLSKASAESVALLKLQQQAQYNQDLAGLANYIQSEGPLTPGKITREQAAQELAKNYSFKDYQQIYQDILRSFPSADERKHQLSVPIFSVQ